MCCRLAAAGRGREGEGPECCMAAELVAGCSRAAGRMGSGAELGRDTAEEGRWPELTC